MSAFAPIGLLKSLLPWNRPWAHLRPLIAALRRPPDDRAALAALHDELTRNPTEIPGRMLWRIWHLAEKAQARPGDAAANRPMDEILRAAIWEAQSPHLRGL